MNSLSEISKRLKTQDNRITQNPMFCVQVKKRDTGYDTSYCDNQCWWNPSRLEVAYDTKPDGDGWEGPFGYKDRWETVMVAFTEAGCQQYIKLNGHNHRGELRIYVESFNRCPEMILIRDEIMNLTPPETAPAPPAPAAPPAPDSSTGEPAGKS